MFVMQILSSVNNPIPGRGATVCLGNAFPAQEFLPCFPSGKNYFCGLFLRRFSTSSQGYPRDYYGGLCSLLLCTMEIFSMCLFASQTYFLLHVNTFSITHSSGVTTIAFLSYMGLYGKSLLCELNIASLLFAATTLLKMIGIVYL